MKNQRLGSILVEQGLIDKQELRFCLDIQRNNGHQRLGHVLCHYDFISETLVSKAVAIQVGWDFYDGEYNVNGKMIEYFGLDFFIQRLVLPVFVNHETYFVLARTDDTNTTDEINQRLNNNAVFLVGVESCIRKVLEELSRKTGEVMTPETETILIEKDLNEWFEKCLIDATVQSASDIHIEPSAKAIAIRMRIDGVLSFYQSLPLTSLSRLINVIFHKSELTISDFNSFHDAKFMFQYLDRNIDIRVSHIPSVHGSSVVLRLLDKARTVLSLSELGYSPGTLKFLQEGLLRPSGIVLVVGPTGCGKTTTLYAILNHLKSIDSKIITIEDPVEIQLPLTTQVQVNDKRDVCFGNAIRAFLRHDPDILLIGEIRDELTAREGLRAAMTGHLVFATLHSNNAFDALSRLNDLGIPFTHLGDHVSMVIAQRLVRKLCLFCKVGQMLRKEECMFNEKKYLVNSQQMVFKPKGCSICREGYSGQVIMAEVIIVNDMSSEIIARGDVTNLKKFIKEGAYPTMIQDAVSLVGKGITSVEEIVRVLG